MQVFKILGLLVLAGILAIAALFVMTIAPKVNLQGLGDATIPSPIIATFEDCVAAGNPVMESYPRQCKTADSRHFVEGMPPVSSEGGDGTGMTFNGCAVAGCSQHLCVSTEEATTIVTTCEFRAEYMCYREASCEPQADGKCGWTQTSELQRCLASPPEMQPEVQ